MATKKSFSIYASSDFVKQVNEMTQRKMCTVGDLARSTLLLFPDETIGNLPDPGEPDRSDREIITLKSGRNKGETLKRKPRLQVRLNRSFEPGFVRKALMLALMIDQNERAVSLEDTKVPSKAERLQNAESTAERMRQIVDALAFTPLKAGVKTVTDALYILGFNPEMKPTPNLVKQRFKMLAMIYHPDSPDTGDTRRMAQINEAMAVLKG